MLFTRRAKKFGFTLIEVIVVIIILGILAAIALPKMSGSSERVLRGEGSQVLIVLLNAQKSYQLENGVYASAIGSLDVDITPAYFNASVSNSAAAVASAARKTGDYTLSIDDTGVVTCSETTAGSCAAVSCVNGGGANQC